MRKYQIYALLQFDSESSGNAAAGVEFNVYNAGGGLATIYAQNGASPISQASPLVTDSNGRYEFYAENGRYSILFTDETIASQNDLTDVSIYEYGSAGARDVATTAEAIAGTSNKLPDTIGVKAAFNQFGLGAAANITTDWDGLIAGTFGRWVYGYQASNSPVDDGFVGADSPSCITMETDSGGYIGAFGFQFETARWFSRTSGTNGDWTGKKWAEHYTTENLNNAQNVSGVTVSSNATIAGSNLVPAKSGTWRNVSGGDILNNGYGLWERVQ